MREQLYKLIIENCGISDIKENDTWKSIGMESLGYIGLIVDIEKMYSIEVKDDLLMYNENTVVEKFVSEIINLISQKDTV